MKKNMEEQTNWNQYYQKKSVFSVLAQSIQRKYIVSMIGCHVDKSSVKTVVELGGADSCLYDKIKKEFDLKAFAVADNSEVGLENFRKSHVEEDIRIELHNCDLLKGIDIGEYDISYSLGLIEHFDVHNTAMVIKSHFDCVKEDGWVLITFPTPTKQYKFVRKFMEIIKVWQFWDERPLECEEVENEINKYGHVVQKQLMRKMPLTQMLYLIKKN